MQQRKGALAFIFVTILIDAMGIGLIAPVLPKLIRSFLGDHPADASRVYGYLMGTYALMIFLCSPLLGALSDRFGRRPVLLFSLTGQGIDYVLLALAPGIWWFALGRMVAGITGASISTAQAYIADVSTPENRASAFGIIGAAFGLGFILGPALGGLLAGYGLRAPFYAAAGLATLNALYGFFVLPESLDKTLRRKFSFARANPFSSLIRLASMPAILGLVAVYFLMVLAGQVFPATWVLFTERRFTWGELDNGISLAYFGLCVGLVSALLTRPIVARIGEKRAVVVGLSLMVLGLALVGGATFGWMLFVFTLPYCLGGIAGPSLQALMTTQVPATEQGQLQGSLTGLMSVAAFLSPLLYTNVFAYFTGPGAPVQVPGVAFWVAGLLMLSALLLALPALKRAPDVPKGDTVRLNS